MNIARSADDKWIAGVAGGLAESLNIDSTIVRIVFATIGVFFFGTGIMLYLVLWALLPRPSGGTIAEDGLSRARAWNADRKGTTSHDGSDFTI